MLSLRLTFVFGALLLGEGCTKKEPSAQAPQAPPPASSPTANVPPRLDASSAQIPAPPSPLKPLAEGKRVRITKPQVPPVEITVPPDFRLRMEGDGGEVRLVAHLEGPALSIEVQEPEGGFSALSLEEDKRSIKESFPKATFPCAYTLEDGSLFIVQDILGSGETEFTVSVMRPHLKLLCTAAALASLEEAERAAAICLSLRSAPAQRKRP